MINTKIHSKTYRYVLLTAAAVFVASAECAIAGGGGNAGDHGFKSHDFNEHGGTSRGFGKENYRLKPSNFQDQGRFGSNASKSFGSKNERPGNSGARATKQGNDAPVGPVARAPATASNNTIRPIIANGTAQNAGEGKLPANNPVGNTYPALGPEIRRPRMARCIRTIQSVIRIRRSDRVRRRSPASSRRMTRLATRTPHPALIRRPW